MTGLSFEIVELKQLLSWLFLDFLPFEYYNSIEYSNVTRGPFHKSHTPKFRRYKHPFWHYKHPLWHYKHPLWRYKRPFWCL